MKHGLHRKNQVQKKAPLRPAEGNATGEGWRPGQEPCWRSLVENADDMIFQCDAAGRLVYVNPASVRLSGYREEELLGKPYLDFVDPSHRQEVGAFYLRQFAEKVGSAYLHVPMVTKGGKTLWLAQKVKPILTGEAVRGWQVMARDISEQRRIRDALEKAEGRYRNLVENSPDFIYYLDAQGRLASVSQLGMLGFSPHDPESPLGQPFADYIHPEDREGVKQSFAEAVAARRATTKGVTFRLVKKSGEVIWVELHSYVLFDDEGRYLEEVGILRDVTDRKGMEERLIALNSQLERMNQDLQAAYQGMRDHRDRLQQARYREAIGFVVDREGRVEWLSEAALAFTGLSREELIGSHLRALLDVQDQPAFLKNLEQAWIGAIYPLRVRMAAKGREGILMEIGVTRISAAAGRRLWVMFQYPP